MSNRYENQPAALDQTDSTADQGREPTHQAAATAPMVSLCLEAILSRTKLINTTTPVTPSNTGFVAMSDLRMESGLHQDFSGKFHQHAVKSAAKSYATPYTIEVDETEILDFPQRDKVIPRKRENPFIDEHSQDFNPSTSSFSGDSYLINDNSMHHLQSSMTGGKPPPGFAPISPNHSNYLLSRRLHSKRLCDAQSLRISSTTGFDPWSNGGNQQAPTASQSSGAVAANAGAFNTNRQLSSTPGAAAAPLRSAFDSNEFSRHSTRPTHRNSTGNNNRRRRDTVAPFRIMDLPSELRLQIYKHHLSISTKHWKLQIQWRNQRQLQAYIINTLPDCPPLWLRTTNRIHYNQAHTPHRLPHALLPILLTSRQIYAEALPVLLSCNHLSFASLNSLRRFLGRNAPAKQHLRFLSVNFQRCASAADVEGAFSLLSPGLKLEYLSFGNTQSARDPFVNFLRHFARIAQFLGAMGMVRGRDVMGGVDVLEFVSRSREGKYRDNEVCRAVLREKLSAWLMDDPVAVARRADEAEKKRKEEERVAEEEWQKRLEEEEEEQRQLREEEAEERRAREVEEEERLMRQADNVYLYVDPGLYG
ncbi:MAG: hypothetical protein M1831_006123 [Alyxoria varia]|nr:MAG: hypothetical protein M1831_006123 [Alyxoria varia]